MPVKTAQMCLVNSFFKLFLTDYMASFPSGLAGNVHAGIYLSFIKENFLHKCVAIVPASLQCDTSKAIFLQAWGGGSQFVTLCIVYIYIICPLKNVI